MAWDDEEDDTIYEVVINHEEQYSIWPADREPPLGWNKVGKSGPKKEVLDYIEEETDGFRVLVRESPVGSSAGNFSSVLNDVAHQVEYILAREFKTRGYDGKLAELYSQALVGMVALTGRWWLDVRKPRRETVAAHLVNLAWNGLSHLDPKPTLSRKAR